MKYFYVSIFSFLLLSCASIPSSTVTLTKEVIKEADNMHALNVSLINKLFDERKEKINLFIENKYTPTLLKKFESLLPDSLDYKKELPNILNSIVPIINHKKDSLQSVLDLQRQDILNQLNSNYSDYSKATTSLQNLINSAVNIKTTESDALSAIDQLTGDKINIKKVENTINQSIDKTGSALNKLVTIEKVISEK
ncbi:hypothetical protein SAMN05444344_1706 [Tenacibaculum mesophilum]|uniref:Lipoprotein n=1 Tax=Tenacibaculum mesophilum TaxID=104268 RepID=A0ABM7CDQ3_9FLAO|nr:hypothetical protein [Tenacibaculum mesophilum]GFD97249.1 hypothetical protein KUL154_59820 [Alteromonas sp. KUL154]GFE03022.1 hypothetical protein KUL156_56140 [Alteromonas sp. KUL156]AZJ31872.1 hypothetical protein D6200_04530 [Tenacibaculum mesophilum]QFS27127.1 hypothetical protein F9Y86_01400 [Tenacibaculum mesophilum]SHF85358.1 hypothetical protein SAMN05444344_1706 [Tenacibaculum mesophilum]